MEFSWQEYWCGLPLPSVSLPNLRPIPHLLYLLRLAGGFFAAMPPRMFKLCTHKYRKLNFWNHWFCGTVTKYERWDSHVVGKHRTHFSDWKGAKRFEMNAPDLTARTLILDRNGKIKKLVQEKISIPNSWVKLKSRWTSWAFLSWKMSDREQTQRHLWAVSGENVFLRSRHHSRTQGQPLLLGFVRWYYPLRLECFLSWVLLGPQSCSAWNFQHPEVRGAEPGIKFMSFP